MTDGLERVPEDGLAILQNTGAYFSMAVGLVIIGFYVYDWLKRKKKLRELNRNRK